jgi:hypothetical protein
MRLVDPHTGKWTIRCCSNWRAGDRDTQTSNSHPQTGAGLVIQ